MRQITEIRRSGDGIEVKIGETNLWFSFDSFGTTSELLDMIRARLDAHEEDVSDMLNAVIADCMGVDIDRL